MALSSALILVSSCAVLPLGFAQNSTLILSPLKQFKKGISIYEIKCKEGLVVVIKKSDNSPACVRPDTAQKLVKRGWGKLQEQTVWFEFHPIQCAETPWQKYLDKVCPAWKISASMVNWRGVIKDYFKEQGITILDVEIHIGPILEIPPPACNQPAREFYLFLIPQSDTQKMTELGFMKAKDNELCGTANCFSP
jgi:hypothetical protein